MIGSGSSKRSLGSSLRANWLSSATACPDAEGPVERLPALSRLLTTATVTPVSVDDRAYELLASGPSDRRRGWLYLPPESTGTGSPATASARSSASSPPSTPRVLPGCRARCGGQDGHQDEPSVAGRRRTLTPRSVQQSLSHSAAANGSTESSGRQGSRLTERFGRCARDGPGIASNHRADAPSALDAKEELCRL